VATRAAIVVTLVATKDMMEVMPEISTDGLQTAQQRGVT